MVQVDRNSSSFEVGRDMTREEALPPVGTSEAVNVHCGRYDSSFQHESPFSEPSIPCVLGRLLERRTKLFLRG